MTNRAHFIVAVAVVHKGILWTLPRPKRHHDVLHYIYAETDELAQPCVQGFIDNFGTFLTREEAFLLASANGQLDRKPGGYQGDQLFSEDLW